jgi:hypothetical protein
LNVADTVASSDFKVKSILVIHEDLEEYIKKFEIEKYLSRLNFAKNPFLNLEKPRDS